MKLKSVLLSWLYLFILCAALGFIPAGTGIFKVLFALVAAVFFVPGFVLLVKADHRDDGKTIRLVRNIALAALVLTTVLIMLNFLSATMSKAWGDVLYVLLVVLSAPLVCGQYWALTLFGWACLMIYGTTLLRKHR
jgi:hypothetical protein